VADVLGTPQQLDEYAELSLRYRRWIRLVKPNQGITLG
jgi:hypothetical protein